LEGNLNWFGEISQSQRAATELLHASYVRERKKEKNQAIWTK
jgi:hypothetical protein